MLYATSVILCEKRSHIYLYLLYVSCNLFQVCYLSKSFKYSSWRLNNGNNGIFVAIEKRNMTNRRYKRFHKWRMSPVSNRKAPISVYCIDFQQCEYCRRLVPRICGDVSREDSLNSITLDYASSAFVVFLPARFTRRSIIIAIIISFPL